MHIITGTDGTKLSEVGGFMLCGTVDVSEASSISGFDGVRAHVDANDTVKTAQVTIHGPSEIDLQSAFEISDNTTTISGGTFGDIEATGTGKVILGATDSRSTGNVTAGNITADEVVGINVKAKSIKANTVTASSITADSITADTLSVLKQSTAKMVNLNVDTIDASTVVLADGAIVNGKDGSSAANIKTDTLQVDSQIAAAGIKNANVTAKTAGKQVSIVGRTGLKIPKKDMEDIAKAANMKEGTYTSATTEAAKKNVTEMLDSADQLGTEGTPSTNTGATKINSDDVTLDDSALAGKLLSLNKGDNVYLLKDRTGTLTYTEGTNVPKLAHTYTDTTDAGTATVATTGSVKQDANDLVLHVDDQKYTFDLSSGAKDKDTFLTSTNTGKTVIRSDDVTLKDGALAGELLSFNKGDNVYLLKDSTGAPTYTEGTNVPALAHTYTSTADAGSATVTTTGTVKQSGNDLVLNIDGVNYAFTLTSATTADSAPLLTLDNAAETKIDASDVTLKADEILSLKKDDIVTLLTKADSHALTYTGTKPLDCIYTKDAETPGAGTAAITTTGTLAQDGKSLVLKVDGVKYAFKLAPTVKDGDTLLTLSYTGDTEIGKGDVTVGTSGVLKNLKKDDKVYLLKKTNGTLIATDITDTVNLPTIYGTITGDVAEDDSNNLVLNVTKAESLTDNLKDKDNPYKYIVVVEDDKKNTENKVTVGASETADKSAIAALAKNDTDDTELKDNTLTVNGKVTGRAVGANSVAGNATQNNVTIGAGATVDGFVAGGMTQDGTANNNTVTINGGTVTGDVYGGYSEKEAKGNTVTMSGGTVKGTIYGSNLGSGASSGTTVKKSSPRRAPALTETESTSSGNTMKIYGKDNTAGNLAKFDNYNFYLPAGTSNGATMLHLTDKADTDMTNSKVTVRANGALNLYNNESVYLIKKDGGSLLTNATIDQDVDLTVGVTAALKGTVENKDNNLVLNIAGPERPKSSGSSGSSRSSSGSSESSNTSSAENAECASSTSESSSSGSSSSASTPVVTINPDTKSAVETRAAQSNVVNMGSDYLVTTTMAQVANADYGADGFASFGGSSGSAHMRYKTGSHVDSRGTAFNAGIAKKNTNKSGTFTWGPFFETGHGDYDSYLDNGTHGSGSTSYTGGGIFARQEFASGLYVEGSLRTGKTKADYSSSDLGTGYSTNAPYFGAHLGVGRVLPMDGGSLDIYGRYLYSRTGSDSVHLATGETYDFDAVDSHRLMLGTRYTREANQLSKWYAGAALLYEFGGEARAHYQGYSLASPSSAGTSVMLEGGWKYTPSANSPFELDLGATGWLGKQQGLMFHAGVNYAF